MTGIKFRAMRTENPEDLRKRVGRPRVSPTVSKIHSGFTILHSKFLC